MAADQERASADLAELQQRWGDEADELCDLVNQWLVFPKPIVAAVNGPVRGLGVALLMASDLIIASEAAQLSIANAQFGLVPGLVTPLVAYRAGPSVAARLAVVGQTLNADEALRLGIYHELLPHHLLWARGMELGSQVATAAPGAIGLTKRLLMETIGEKLLTDLASGAIASATARTTDAAREGLRSLRRRP